MKLVIDDSGVEFEVPGAPEKDDFIIATYTFVVRDIRGEGEEEEALVSLIGTQYAGIRTRMFVGEESQLEAELVQAEA